MNIQIFGRSKCFETKKAERYFKERGIRFQSINLNEKEMSRGEFTRVKQAVGGLENMIDQACRDRDLLALIQYIAQEDREEKVFENQKVLKPPIVRKRIPGYGGISPGDMENLGIGHIPGNRAYIRNVQCRETVLESDANRMMVRNIGDVRRRYGKMGTL